MSALQTETQHDTTTFEHFDRTWTVPVKRHLSHVVRMRDEMKAGVGTMDLLIAETFLPAAEFRVLVEEVDPDDDAFDAFTSRIAEVMGLGNSGNS